MNGEIISYLELCVREKAHLQHGMNWRIQSTHSVFLMSTRKSSPYDDRIEDEGRTLIYEGHDAPKKNSNPSVFAKGSRMKDVNWIANTTRGTNDYMHCSHLIYLYDQNINPVLARWLGDSTQVLKTPTL